MKNNTHSFRDRLVLICLIATHLAFNSTTYASEASYSINTVHAISPGSEIRPSSSEKKCQVYLLIGDGTLNSVEVQLGGPSIYEDRVIWGLVGLTQVGSNLLENLEPRIRSGELKFAKMPTAMIERFKAEVSRSSKPSATYIHKNKTVYLNEFKNTGELLLSLVHELQHASDLLSRGSYPLTLSPQEELSLEFAAFATEDRFFEELAVAAPCFKNLFPDFPRKYSTENIKEMYPHLR